MEEDYDGYIENLMVQLRQLPPITIVEPELGRNYNVCAVPGMGDTVKLNTKGYSMQTGDLEGSFGNSRLKHRSDYYNTRPFGDEYTTSTKVQPAHRGFYNQEFAPPRLGPFGKLYFMLGPDSDSQKNNEKYQFIKTCCFMKY